MSQQIASLYAEIGANTTPFEQGAKRVKQQLQGLVPGIEKARTGLMDFASANVGLLAALAGVGAALKYSVDQAAEAQAVDAQLDAVLRSTGGAAGMAKDELDKLAVSLSKVSTYDDEAIKSTEALLLTFTNVGSDVFPQATKAILDMSTAMGQDLKSSTIQIGKALNDPIAGLTSLTRVGVTFTEEQKKLIKTLVETGDKAGAQKIILQELSKEFGGSALAAAKTYEGQIKQLKNEIGNLGEEIGTGALPIVSSFVSDLNDLAEITTTVSAKFKGLGNVLGWLLTPQIKIYQATKDWRQELFALLGATNESNMGVEEQAAAFNMSAASIDGNTQSLENNAAALKEISEVNQGMLGLIGDLQSVEDEYNENKQRLAEERLGIAADDLAALDENTRKVQENQAAYDLANKEIISGLIERKLMQDGVLDDAEFEWLLAKRQEWGLYSADVVEKARAAWQEADKITASIANIPENKNVTVSINYVQTGGELSPDAGGGNYPARAAGGPASGLTWVGEAGKELVNLPTGSHVYSNTQSMKMSGGQDSGLLNEILQEMRKNKIDTKQLARDIVSAGAGRGG